MELHKILVFDIETAPMISHHWNPKAEWIPPVMNISKYYMLSWAAKWAGKRGVFSDFLTAPETHAADDDRIVLSLADLMREADIVVAHNGDRFDIKKVNWRVAKHGQEPLGPIRSIDTLKLSRNSFGTEYHNLNELGMELCGHSKIKTDWELWEHAKNGDEAAMRKMVRYNRRDVTLLEEVFEAMKPYVKTLPRMVEGSGTQCPYCGMDVIKRGVKHTNAGTYQQYQCKECQRYCRYKKADFGGLDTRPV